MMRQNDRTTLYVDFAHIELVNQTLGEAIQTQYFRYYFELAFFIEYLIHLN